MKLYTLTAHEAGGLLRKKEITSVELTRSVLDRINEVEDKVGGYITILEDEAIKMAKEADERLQKGENVHDLTGIPLAVKDNICTKDIKTTCASKMLENFIPPYDAAVSKKLKEEGVVYVGKANMDEFAMGSTTEHSYFKKTINPYGENRVPGGSSGGSAAIIAADEAIAALGSDTGGSIRQPAALCGVVGLKPTYGLVSRFGLVAFASSLDQIGPITKDVTDCAILLNSIVFHDKMDSTSLKVEKPDYKEALIDDVKNLKIGVPKEYFGEGISGEVKEGLYKAIEKFKEMGAQVGECSLPRTDYALSAYYIISSAEASSNLARYDGIRYGYRAKEYTDLNDLYSKTRSEGFGAEVKRRIMLGTYALSSGYYDAYYKKAQQVRTLIKEDFDKAFEKFDVLITPTSPTTAWKIREKTLSPTEMYLADICTVSINIAGLPAISIPCGYSSENLPIGMQIIGKPFGESTILRAAYAFEKSFKNNLIKPNL